jgi:hypothetical protein
MLTFFSFPYSWLNNSLLTLIYRQSSNGCPINSWVREQRLACLGWENGHPQQLKDLCMCSLNPSCFVFLCLNYWKSHHTIFWRGRIPILQSHSGRPKVMRYRTTTTHWLCKLGVGTLILFGVKSGYGRGEHLNKGCRSSTFKDNLFTSCPIYLNCVWILLYTSQNWFSYHHP